MRICPLHLLLLASLALPGAGVAAPALKALADWQPGNWQEATGHGPNTARQNYCLSSPDQLLIGQPGATTGCRFTTIRNDPSTASVTYQCQGNNRQGRADLRRDTATVYTVYAQGVNGRQPFANRSEWRRIGGC